MVKSGLEKNIMKFHVPLQCKNLTKKAEMARQEGRYLWSGMWNFKISFSRPLFTIIFKPKMVILRLLSLIRWVVVRVSKICSFSLVFPVRLQRWFIYLGGWKNFLRLSYIYISMERSGSKNVQSHTGTWKDSDQ